MHKPATSPLAGRSASDKNPVMSSKMTLSRLRAIAALAALGLSVSLDGCATGKDKAEPTYVAQDVARLYNCALQSLEQKRYQEEAPIFEGVKSRTPHTG